MFLTLINLPLFAYPCYHNNMGTPLERILIVEGDPDISDLIARQVLQPLGYRTKVVRGAPSAIQEAASFSPDLVIANLDLPELSGKDLLVALSSQGAEIPVIVIAEQGFEEDVIQAFRLGATDFLKKPLREAEIVSAVERVIKQVRAKRDRILLAHQLERTNQELKRRVRDLTTIFGIGKAITSITDRQALFDRIVEGAVSITDADKGWLYLRKGDDKVFVLRACRNLPNPIASKLNQEWDDGISSLVALSGESFSIYGDALKRFKVSQLGKSALVTPVKAQEEVIGLLVTVREESTPFDSGNQTMLEAVADYISVSLVNARLFQALEEQARAMQSMTKTSLENHSAASSRNQTFNRGER
ncbi:MAG: response regulator [Chloroflexi bacterium]|nr:response regulator [Chloroflexota bacterium]